MVQQFREQEVQTSGQVPGYQNVQYNPDAFGASIGRALQGAGDNISELGATVAKIDSEKKANDVLDKRNQMADSMRTVLFDPNTGIYAQQGKNAMDSSERLAQAQAMLRKKYIDEETDPQKRATLDRMWSREEQQTKDSVASHQLHELGTYKQQTAKATMFSSMEDGYNYYNNDSQVDAAIKRATLAIDVNTEGLPAEAVDAAKAEAKSNIRLAAISRWAAEDPSKAYDYYMAHKDDLNGKDHITASQFVRAGRVNQESQFEVAKIVSQRHPNLFGAMQQAESENNTQAESPAGAVGLMQVMPETAREVLRKAGRYDLAVLSQDALKQKLKDDPQLNQQLGMSYMTEQLEKFGGDTEAALVAYNAGPEAAKAFLAHNAGKTPGNRDYDVPGWKGLKSETEGYVQKVLANVNTPATPQGLRMNYSNWSLKNFSPKDLMAPTRGGQWVDARAAQGLDRLADVMKSRFPGFEIKVNEGRPVVPGSNAGNRRGTADPLDNPHVKHSQHLYGKAFDVQVQSWSDDQKAAFVAEARKLGFAGFGFYGPKGHLHIDMGKERTWGPVPAWAKEALTTPVNAKDNAVSVDMAAQTPGQQTTYQPGGSDPSGYFINAKESSLDYWLSQAELIDDPAVRERTMAQLRVEAANMDQQAKEEAAGWKQSAWDTIIRGGSVKNLDPATLSRLDPSFVNTLNTYEENRAKGGAITDPKAFYQLQQMSEEDFVKTDLLTDFANKLSPSDFQEQARRQTETRNKLEGKSHDADLLANTASRSDIMADIARSQGWKSDDAALSTFNAAFGRRIQGEQANKVAQGKGRLNEDEMRDIADKLLIEDKYSSYNPFSSAYYTGSKQGTAIEATDPSTFTAASSWQDVQPDDQKTLIDYYQQQFGMVPDQDHATELYNRAFRVWLGAKPDGPDTEQAMLREAVEARIKRQLTPEEFEKAYARYLLAFLGR